MPLARNVAEAKRMVELVKKAGVLHGYLEDQLFAPGLQRGHAIAWARGAQCMVAHVQLETVRFFEDLGWRTDGPAEIYVGIPHQPMIISW